MMSDQPSLTLHVLPPSHPCMTAEAGLRHKGLEYEKVTLQAGAHTAEIERLYGDGKTTVPGLMVGDEAVHGSTAILARLEELRPEPALYPEPIADRVREAEEWGDRELQDLGRRLPFGAMHFRPEAMGTFGGGGALEPAGVDFAMKLVRAAWRYHAITAERLAGDLAGLPAKIAQIESLAADGVIGGEPNAADLQIGATLRVLATVGDLAPLLEGTAGLRLAHEVFPDYAGKVPAGAFPAGWIPA